MSRDRRALIGLASLWCFPGLCGAAAPAAWTQTASSLYDEIVRARDLICEMRSTDATDAKRPRQLMLIFENVSAKSQFARVLTSVTIGARPVKVYPGSAGVHFVENVESSFKVTTLLACTHWKEGGPGRHCVRYDAVNRWHFDASVHLNPDASFLRRATNSYSGWCEPWHMN